MKQASGAAAQRLPLLRCTSKLVTSMCLIALATACPSTNNPTERLHNAVLDVDRSVIQARVPRFENLSSGRVSRGSGESASVLKLRAAAFDVLASRESGDPYAVAVASLIVGRAGEAVALLNQPSSAAEWAALAAARIEHAVSIGDTRELLRAVGAADRALEIDANSADALYNRMLALELLGFSFATREAASRYLATEATSHWADEVRRRTAAAHMTRAQAWKSAQLRLERATDAKDFATVSKIVDEFPQETRSWAEVEYLGRWAEAIDAGHSDEAMHWLELARAVGNALRLKSGEGLLISAIGHIDVSQGDPVALSQIVSAQQIYRRARQEFHRRRAAEALPMFLDAERRFRMAACGSFANVVSYYVANALYDLHRDAEATEVLDRVFRDLRSDHRALRAQSHWLRSSLSARTGRSYDALVEARESLQHFEKLGEFDNAVRMRSACATSLIILGRTNEGWQMHGRAFAGAASSGSRWLIEQVLNDAVRNAIRDGEWLAARALVTIEAHEPSVSPRLRVDALLWREFLDVRVRADAPRPTFAAARAAAQAMKDESLRADALEDLDFATALVSSGARPFEAVTAMSRVIERQTRTKRHVDLATAYLERARAYRTGGDHDDAIRDLVKATKIIEQGNAFIGRDLIRDTFFGRADAAFEELADLLVLRGDLDGAFRVIEEARARILVDREHGRNGTNTRHSLRQTCAALPSDVILAHYTAFADRLLILTIEKAGYTVVTKQVPRAKIALARDAFAQAITRDDEQATNNYGRELYALLIEPLEKRLSAGQTLVVVADQTLAAIPFSALIDNSGRFLIESFPVVISPSAAIFVHLNNRAERSFGTVRMNVIADPTFDLQLMPRLSRLPAAAEEARLIARSFTSAHVVTGSDATRSAFLNLIRSKGILHIAAHAVTNARDASLSVIPLAPDSGDRGLLHLHDISELDLRDTPLVMLAGCRTASTSAGHGTMRSLSAAFLAAGADSVLASLWDVDDASTSDLSLRLYRHLFDGRRPAEALRLAQVEMIGSSDAHTRRARAWGALQIYGRG